MENEQHDTTPPTQQAASQPPAVDTGSRVFNFAARVFRGDHQHKPLAKTIAEREQDKQSNNGREI